MSKTRISGANLVIPFDLTYAAGMMVNHPTHFYGPHDATLGHSGWGGSCAHLQILSKASPAPT